MSDMLDAENLVFIVDLNELENGDEIPVSMDFTCNFGPMVLGPTPMPKPGETVRVHSDDDNTLYYATVLSRDSERDLTVQILWDSRTPVLNNQWSARDDAIQYSGTAASANQKVT